MPHKDKFTTDVSETVQSSTDIQWQLKLAKPDPRPRVYRTLIIPDWRKISLSWLFKNVIFAWVQAGAWAEVPESLLGRWADLPGGQANRRCWDPGKKIVVAEIQVTKEISIQIHCLKNPFWWRLLPSLLTLRAYNSSGYSWVWISSLNKSPTMYPCQPFPGQHWQK